MSSALPPNSDIARRGRHFVKDVFQPLLFLPIGRDSPQSPPQLHAQMVERRDPRSVRDVKKRQSGSVRVTSSLPLKAQIGPALIGYARERRGTALHFAGGYL